jgi:hypothetical protein
MLRYRRILFFLMGMLALGGALPVHTPALAGSGTPRTAQSRLVVFEAFMRDT